MPTAQYYQNLIASSPNLQKFLNTIGWAEGATYNVGYGGRVIGDLSQHPYSVGQFRIVDPVTGKTSTTSAAGKYQFERSTWNSISAQLGLPNFSPASQDIAAAALIDQSGALPDVINGNVTSAVSKLQNVWQGFITKPLSSIVAKFNGSTATATATAPGASSATPINFNQYMNIPVIGAQNRYLIAFAILVIIFIFAFN